MLFRRIEVKEKTIQFSILTTVSEHKRNVHVMLYTLQMWNVKLLEFTRNQVMLLVVNFQ